MSVACCSLIDNYSWWRKDLSFSKYWLYLEGLDNNPLQHISFATYRDGSLYNFLCLFLIISFKLYIAVFATTLIIMQNYRQKVIPPNILILFKKKRFSKEKTLWLVGSGLKFLHDYILSKFGCEFRISEFFKQRQLNRTVKWILVH